MIKKISEIRLEKTVQRPARDEYGNLYYEEHTFLMKYSPSIKSHFPRAWAKCIDVLIFFLPALRFGYEFWPALGIAIVLVDIYSTVSESKLGDTLGKRLLGLKVIDDNGNYPSFWLSLKRNALAVLNLTPKYPTSVLVPNVVTGSVLVYNMNLTNSLCHTYVVNKENLPQIKALQAEGND